MYSLRDYNFTQLRCEGIFPPYERKISLFSLGLMYQIGEKRCRSRLGACLPCTNMACGGILEPPLQMGWAGFWFRRPSLFLEFFSRFSGFRLSTILFTPKSYLVSTHKYFITNSPKLYSVFWVLPSLRMETFCLVWRKTTFKRGWINSLAFWIMLWTTAETLKQGQTSSLNL